MLSLRKPSADEVHRFLREQAKLSFTYAAVGATADKLPAGYVVDHTRIKLGEGESVFQAAKAALQRWDQFRLGWLEAGPAETPIKTGEVVAILARAIGLWWLNGCRIVYVVDETGPVSKFGFAYGTLPDHAGIGEERFLIEWEPGRQQCLVRHPGVFTTEPLPGPTWLSPGSSHAETIRAGIGGRHAACCP